MNYISNTKEQITEMKKEIGISSFEELFKDMPEDKIIKSLLKLPKGISEIDVKRKIESLSAKNNSGFISFLGGGSYNHFIPSVVNHIISRSEFYTAYTPYQPEISQGILQAIYEYQSMICELTGMDATNASMYDGASALSEAALMAYRITKRKEVLVSSLVNPEYKKTLKTYLDSADIILKEIDFAKGVTSFENLKSMISENTACVIIQSPNYFGSIEDFEEISKFVHENSSLLIANVVEPTSLGLLKAPGEYVDIVTGEGQSFGNPMNYGGPYLGIIATKKKYMRQLPGRIVGATVDSEGEKGYVLTLQAREQHIRRDTATSNICSNEALCALGATVYLSLIGKNLRKLALINVSKSHYTFEKLKDAGLNEAYSTEFYNEFVLKSKDAKGLLLRLREENIVGGISIEEDYPEFKDCILVCATEMNTKEEIDKFAGVVKEFESKL